MRKFYLHTYDKSHSFDLNNESALASEPSGLGNGFQTSYKESDKGRHITNIAPKFEDIKLRIYFNADGTDGYVNYKGLASFLTICGTSKFIFEYDDGVTDKFCDVVLKSISKSEISAEGIFSESLTLERQTYWYEVIDEEFVFSQVNEIPVFPLAFPFGFQGMAISSEKSIENNFFAPAPVLIRISGQITEDLNIYIKDTSNTVLSEICISEELPDGAVVLIDPATKKITITAADGTVSNGYEITDKSKQSFLYLPQGKYIIGANIAAGALGKTEISVKRYLFD